MSSGSGYIRPLTNPMIVLKRIVALRPKKARNVELSLQGNFQCHAIKNTA
jgi:hypothetical protein